jgi:hypothetical protein
MFCPPYFCLLLPRSLSCGFPPAGRAPLAPLPWTPSPSLLGTPPLLMDALPGRSPSPRGVRNTPPLSAFAVSLAKPLDPSLCLTASPPPPSSLVPSLWATVMPSVLAYRPPLATLLPPTTPGASGLVPMTTPCVPAIGPGRTASWARKAQRMENPWCSLVHRTVS